MVTGVDTHTRADITLRGGDGVCVGNFPLIRDETDTQLAGRWDTFAALVYHCGLGMTGDEPSTVTIGDDGVITQHFELTELDDVDAAA